MIKNVLFFSVFIFIGMTYSMNKNNDPEYNYFLQSSEKMWCIICNKSLKTKRDWISHLKMHVESKAIFKKQKKINE